MSAPNLIVREVMVFERDVRLRLPFRFGVITLTEAPQAFARVRVALEGGGEAWGVAAEMMVPKWFDKSPDLSNDANIDQLRLACGLAIEAYRDRPPASAFGLAASAYPEVREAGARLGLNGLVAGFGGALLDRAVLDALCRVKGLSFFHAMQTNLPGVAPDVFTPDLAGFDLDRFLAGQSRPDSIHARHTVGMLDPLVAADQSADERLDDGLPETLEEVIAAYGHRYFKVKVRGELDADMDRLCSIAALLDRSVPDYQITLDGNEQYDGVESVSALWQAIEAEPKLARFRDSILFIEQPIKRAVALEYDVSALAQARPVILDESDDGYEVFAAGRARGYTGISSKTCKGIYKSILNAARCAAWNDEVGSDRFFMSAEDLTCQAGVSVQQDLALVSLLGLAHVERNGHHYVHGMAGAPPAEQQAFTTAHPDLYRSVGGDASLAISRGRIELGSLDCAGYAVDADPDWAAMRAMPDTMKPADRMLKRAEAGDG